MKNIARLIVVGALAAALSVTAFAQGAGPGQGKPGGKPGQAPGLRGGGPGGGGMQRMKEARDKVFAKLNLTANQKQLIADLDKKREAQMKALFEKNKGKEGNRDAMREEFQKMRKSYETSLNKILTPAQQKTLKEEMDKLRKNRPGKPGGAEGQRRGKPGKPGAGSNIPPL